MNKMIILLFCIFLACSSTFKKKLEITTKKLDLPLKILHMNKGNDSTYIFLCFPKTIVYDNHYDITNELIRFNVNYYPVGTNSRDFRTYKYYNNKLNPVRSFNLENKKRDSFDIFYGYSIRISNIKLDSLISNQKIIQSIGNYSVYDVSISKSIKNWALSKINDSIKGQLHFKLYNKEKGFFYKSLDIELFED
jgi:hypothetical protein